MNDGSLPQYDVDAMGRKGSKEIPEARYQSAVKAMRRDLESRKSTAKEILPWHEGLTINELVDAAAPSLRDDYRFFTIRVISQAV